MKEVIPFTSKDELAKAIDNGGRFYNIFTDADDNVVSKAELAKAAGVIAAGQVALLFLDLAANDLSETDRNEIVSMLEPTLRDRFRDYVRVQLEPSKVEASGEAGECVVVEGFTRRLTDKTQFTGFIMIPNGSTFTMIPMLDMYDVYEVYDENESNTASALVAAKLGSNFSDGTRIRFGGYLRSLLFQDESTRTHKFYLESSYFTRLS